MARENVMTFGTYTFPISGNNGREDKRHGIVNVSRYHSPFLTVTQSTQGGKWCPRIFSSTVLRATCAVFLYQLDSYTIVIVRKSVLCTR